jgi:ATP-binding cassette subfamily B protein
MAHPLLRCFALYRLHLGLLISVTLAIALVNASMPLTQYFIGRALHELDTGVAVVRLPDGRVDAHRAWMWAEIMISVAIARGLAQYLSTILSQVLGQRLLHTLRSRLFARVQSLDLVYHLRHGAGEIINRTTRDSDKVRDAVVYGYRTLIELIMIVSASLFILCYYHWLLAAVPAALVGIALLIGAGQSQRLVALNQKSDLSYDQVAQDLSEGVHGVRVIKSFALERQRISGFVNHVEGFVQNARNALNFTAVRLPLPQLIVALGHTWVLGCGAYLVVHGLLNRGELIAAMMAMQSIVFRVESIGRLIQVFSDARASAGRVMELMDARPGIVAGPAALPGRPLSLRLEDVSIRGTSNEVLLEHISFDLRPGEIIALVGATGSGKSTLASLLPRLRDPDSGRVLIGSQAAGWTDLRELRLDELRQAVQVVYQDSFLFSESLAGNLRLAAPSATDAELTAAISMAAADDVLTSLPQGLASRIGERGVTLSGGQRQRLCIARALLSRPAILCFDDATSALDSLTERRLLMQIRGAAQAADAKAILLIASKLSTIRLADRVMVLERGRMIATGTHGELIANSPFYRDLLGITEEDIA